MDLRDCFQEVVFGCGVVCVFCLSWFEPLIVYAYVSIMTSCKVRCACLVGFFFSHGACPTEIYDRPVQQLFMTHNLVVVSIIFLCSSLLGKMIQFEQHFSSLKPPTGDNSNVSPPSFWDLKFVDKNPSP